MSRKTPALFIVVLMVTAATVRADADAEQIKADEKLLQSALQGTDGAALVEFFRKRTAGVADRERINGLIKKLGDVQAEADRATAELVAAGPAVLPILKEAQEKRPGNRIKRCVQILESTSPPALTGAAARLIALRMPAGAVAALLAYCPADKDDARSVIQEALLTLSRRDGKVDPVLIAALDDKAMERRSIAAEIVCRLNARSHLPAVRRLLADHEPTVRLRVALALSSLRDADAVPVLIALLVEAPPVQARQAEEALLHVAGVLAPSAPLGKDKDSRDAWADWWQSTAGDAAPAYFRARTLPDDAHTKVASMVRALGDPSFKVREKSMSDILALRRLALPILKAAIDDADLEVRERIRRLLGQLAKAADTSRTVAHVRLLVLRQPTKAAEILLAFLPFAEGDAVEDEIREALIALASMDSLAHASLLSRLDDKFPQRRAAAAEALAHTGRPEHLKVVRRLLSDDDPSIRLRVALALAAQKERDAIPALIALLAELPVEQARQAEEILRALAEKDAPAATLSDVAAERRKCRDAWTVWWKTHGENVDLARLDSRNRHLGYTVLARWGGQNQTNELLELGVDGRVRWKLDNLGFTFDFHVLPGNKLLVVEHNQQRVSERNFKGDILWQFKVTYPLNCQRLPNGNTFIAASSEVLEVDRNGTVLYRITRSIMSGGKLSDGRIVVLDSGGTCSWLDTTGKVLKSVKTGGGVNNLAGMDILPRGRVLLALYSQGRVVEYDADGKEVWQTKLQTPSMASRLANGNTLVCSQEGRYAVEVDSTGRVVWEHRPGTAVWRGRKR